MRWRNILPSQNKCLRNTSHWGVHSALWTSEEVCLGLPVMEDWQQPEGQATDGAQVPWRLRQCGKNGGTDSSKLSSSSSGPWPPGLPLEPVTAGCSSLFCWVHHETKFFPELWLTLLELIKLKVFQPVWMSPFSSRYCGQGYFCFQFSISQEMQQKGKKES